MKQPPKGMNLRADSAWVLYQILEAGVSARECLPLATNKYPDPRDRNWLNEITMGVLRKLPLLQSWLRPMLAKPLKDDKKIVEHLLLVGFYQLAFMRVSSHAATNETVNATRFLKADGLKGLVNGILRQFQREERSEPSSDAIKAGLPAWYYKKLVECYPEHYPQIISEQNSKASIWLRINTQKITVSAFLATLDKANIEYSRPDTHANAVILAKGDITQLPGFEQGYFAVQDGAAQMAAVLLSPKNGDRILDCCAAPGGKTCHLYELAPESSITAIDSDKLRLRKIEENLTRLGAKAHLLHGDACFPETWWNNELYDRILLDAPCSATGIIRRHPDIRWHRKASDIAQLVELQSKILNSVWPLLKPGGTLLYATCSILHEENTEQVAAFLTRTKNAVLDDYERQILPGEEQMDGFYYARLVKSGSE